MGIDRHMLLAWNMQKHQVVEWKRGDAFAGAVAAFRSFINVTRTPAVKKHFWRHLLSNILVLLAVVELVLVNHLIVHMDSDWLLNHY